MRDFISRLEIVQNNLAALEQVEQDGKTFGQLLREWEKLGQGISIRHEDRIRCVGCAGAITMKNLQYFGFDVTEVLCWSCQHWEGPLPTDDLQKEKQLTKQA